MTYEERVLKKFQKITKEEDLGTSDEPKKKIWVLQMIAKEDLGPSDEPEPKKKIWILQKIAKEDLDTSDDPTSYHMIFQLVTI